MSLKYLPIVLAALLSCTNAALFPRATTSYSNTSFTTTTVSSSSSSVTPVCCFVVQDTVTEDWWQITSLSTSYTVANVTSITTFYTIFPNYTSTRIEEHVFKRVNTSSVFTSTVGRNPISNYLNIGGPDETTEVLTGTAVVTGGVTVQSPAAFYVYSTVKIITASQVEDENGKLVCATVSTNERIGVFDNINTNAQQYFFGGGNVKRTMAPILTDITTDVDTWTFQDPSKYTTTATEIATSTKFGAIHARMADDRRLFDRVDQPTAVVISLVTPFIYQPARGATGATGTRYDKCLQGPGSENYGYVPQTLLDYLIQNPQYSKQYPGLESCLPGGPAVEFLPCAVTTPPPPSSSVFSTSVQTAVGGDLTDRTIVYVTAPIPSKPIDVTHPTTFFSIPPINTPLPRPNPTPSPEPEKPPVNTPVNTPPAEQKQQPTDLGGLINSIMGGDPATNPPSPTPLPSPQNENRPPVVIPGPTTIAVGEAPPGLQGAPTVIGGSSYIVVPAATTLPAQGNGPAIGQTTMLPFLIIPATTVPVVNAPAGLQGETTVVNNTPYLVIPQATTIAAPQPTPFGNPTVINGSPMIVINGPTNIPLNNAPAGLAGATTVIDGTSYLVVPNPTTIAAPAGYPAPIPAYPTAQISGQPYVILPAGTVPAAGLPTNIPGASTTIINGTPYLILPTGATIPAPTAPANNVAAFQTTVIGGSTYLVLPSATLLPVSAAPGSLLSGASTTLINGTPYYVLNSGTTVPIPKPTPTNGPANELTVIVDGTSQLIISGPTTMPINPYFSIDGVTTVIDGTTKVIVTAKTTIKGSGTARSSSVRSSATTKEASSTTTNTGTGTSAPKKDAAVGTFESDKWFMWSVNLLGLVLAFR